MILIRGLRLSL